MAAAKTATALDNPDFARFRHAADTLGEFGYNLVLKSAYLLDVLLWGRKIQADIFSVLRLMNYGGDVQQRFRWDTTNIQTDAAEGRVPLDKNDLQSQISSAKGCGITARPAAQNYHLGLHRIRHIFLQKVAYLVIGRLGWQLLKVNPVARFWARLYLL